MSTVTSPSCWCQAEGAEPHKACCPRNTERMAKWEGAPVGIAGPAHNGHPMRHWDRTCPACNPDAAAAPGSTDAERAAWLADKIVAHGDYAKEAAAMLRRWPAGVPVSQAPSETECADLRVAAAVMLSLQPRSADIERIASTLQKLATAGVTVVEPCPRGNQKPEPSCTNRHQCWEPCGELGKSEEHVRVGRQSTAGVAIPDGGQSNG